MEGGDGGWRWRVEVEVEGGVRAVTFWRLNYRLQVELSTDYLRSTYRGLIGVRRIMVCRGGKIGGSGWRTGGAGITPSGAVLVVRLQCLPPPSYAIG